MTIARHYKMTANEGQADTLLDALKVLAETVKGIPGCSAVEILQDVEQPARFVFIEKWTSVDAHKAAGPMVSKEVMAPVMAALAERPEGAYLEYR